MYLKMAAVIALDLNNTVWLVTPFNHLYALLNS